MSKHHLYRAKVSPVGEKVGCKGVPQGVWGKRFVYTCNARIFFDYLPETQAGHGFTPIGDKKAVAPFAIENYSSSFLHILFQCFFGWLAEGNNPLLISLAKDTNEICSKVTGGKGEAYKFGYPQSR